MPNPEKGSVLEVIRFGVGRNKRRDDVDLKPIEEDERARIYLKKNGEGRPITSGPSVEARARQRERTKKVKEEKIRYTTPTLELTFPKEIAKRSLLINDYGNVIPRNLEKNKEQRVVLDPNRGITVTPFVGSLEEIIHSAQPPAFPTSSFKHLRMTYDELVERVQELGITEEVLAEVLQAAAAEEPTSEPSAQPEPQGSQPQNVVVYPES